jgi:hypothetical protein
LVKRIYPTEVTVDCYVEPQGRDLGRTRFIVLIFDDKHSKELLYTWDHAEALRFARRSAGQRGLPVVDRTVG